MKHRPVLGAGLALAALVAPSGANAALHARADAGADPAAVTDTRDAIRLDFGGGDVAAANGSFGGLRREINWDGVGDAQSAPNAMPPDQFRARGVVFSTPGSALEVSANDPNAAVVPLRFGNVDPGYTALFQTFSGDQIFRGVGSNVVDVDFVVPGTSTPATTRGFGVVFADVDGVSSSKIEAWDVRGTALGTAFAAPADGGLSVASLVSDLGAPIAKIRITSGTTALGPGVLDTATIDVAVMDDLIYGEPQATADLGVTVTDGPDPVAVRTNLTYTVTVANSGQGTADASLQAALPPGLAIGSVTPSQGTCATTTSCALGALPGGASATVTYVVSPTKAGTVDASFTATAANDPVAANDTGTASTTVTADTKAPKVVIKPGTLTARQDGRFALKVTCPAGESRCTGLLRMTTASIDILGRSLRLDLGSTRFRVDGGKTRTLSLRLRPAERTLLKDRVRIKLHLSAEATDLAGNRGTVTKTVILRAPKQR